MLRIALVGACRRAAGGQQLIRNALASVLPARPVVVATAPQQRNFSLLLVAPSAPRLPLPLLSANPAILALSVPARTVTKFSLRKGKRKTVKAVLKRFMRLDWGGWIRTRQGRHKKMWRKSGALKRRLRQHVLVNAQQSWLLDKMVTPFWRRPRHYVDDPYRPYHSREEFTATRKQPLKYD